MKQKISKKYIVCLLKTGMAALGIFIGTIFAWLTISVDWPGCISMVAIIVFGVATYTQVFQWSLGSWVSTLCIFSFLLGAALESSGWTKRIAAWFSSPAHWFWRL